MMTNRIKVQGKRHKVRGPRFFPCTLHLIKLLAIRLGWQTTPAKSLVIAPFVSRLVSPAFQHGFSLVSAIFLLVVIAALGTFAVTLSTNQQQSAALDVLGARAYQASRAGIEWGAYQAIINPGAIICATLPATAPNGPIVMANTLQNFNVMVDCGSTAASEASATITMYQLTSTARQGTVATPNYVERQMSVTIAK
jgi:MSHA biogenesis protein MshP